MTLYKIWRQVGNLMCTLQLEIILLGFWREQNYFTGGTLSLFQTSDIGDCTCYKKHRTIIVQREFPAYPTAMLQVIYQKTC